MTLPANPLPCLSDSAKRGAAGMVRSLPARTKIALCCLVLSAFGAAASAQENPPLVGTIVSVRGNILAVRPTLRPKIVRVAFGEKTQITGSERASLSVLKAGMRASVGERYNEKDGLIPRWIEASESPIGSLAEKMTGQTLDKAHGWGRVGGTIKRVQPLVIRDDAGTDFTIKTDTIRRVWHSYLSNRSTLLIGTRIEAVGTTAPDGVMQAATISPDRDYTASGTMFGTLTAVNGSTLTVRPRYAQDVIAVHLGASAPLLRQVNVDPDTLKVGDRVTFWGEQRPNIGMGGDASDLKPFALLLGANRYPKSEGAAGGVYLHGTLASIDPVRLKLPNGKVIRVIIPAQMPTARLETVRSDALKPGAEVMLVLTHNADGSFTTATVILDASPFVGYGG